MTYCKIVHSKHAHMQVQKPLLRRRKRRRASRERGRLAAVLQAPARIRPTVGSRASTEYGAQETRRGSASERWDRFNDNPASPSPLAARQLRETVRSSQVELTGLATAHPLGPRRVCRREGGRGVDMEA
jgi:hypothetical protein